ncbi:MAG TPA: hypothetical protein VM266_07345 [Solirubrobacteraceae bacterium]|nr:hypothetical protein [Solirubrobacteraceae bacterium]
MGHAVRDALRLAPLAALYLLVCAVAQPDAAGVRDEPALLAAAERLAADGVIAPAGSDPDQRAYLWHGPGLVALLAPLVALDLPLTAIRFVEPLLLTGAVLLFHRLLRERLAPRPALAWTYALGLYVPFHRELATVQKEPLAVLLVVAGMLALSRGLRTGRRRTLALAGVALWALVMVRPEYGWVTLALLAAAGAWWLARRRSITARRLVAVAAVATAGCVPWLAYTQVETGQPLYWSASGGLSLFWMSPTLPGQHGQWHSPVRVYRDPALAPYRPLFRRLDEVHPLDSDLELRRRAVENIRERPGVYARNLVANAGRLFFHVPMDPPRHPVIVASTAIPNALLLAALLWGAPRLWRRRRSLPPETAPLLVFAALAIAVHLPPAATPRMLLPVVPVLVWLVAEAARGQRQGAENAAPSRSQ